MDNQNFSDFSTIASTRHTFLIIHEVIFTIFCVLGICINITIINTVYGFNRMRKPSNIFIANWAIADIFSLLLTPTAYDIIAGLSRFMGYIPLIVRIGMLMHTAEILCVAVVAIDWFLAAYFSRASGYFRKYYRYVIGLIWIFAMVAILVSLTFCRKHWYCKWEGIELLISYLALLLIIIVVQSWRGVQKCRRIYLDKPVLFINLASIFLLTWGFGFCNMVMISWIVSHPLISIILDCLMFSTSLVNFLLLYYFNQDFQACFSQILSRSRNKYTEEIPDLAENVPEFRADNGTNNINTSNNLP